MGYIGNITHLLTIDPDFQRDIQVGVVGTLLQLVLCSQGDRFGREMQMVDRDEAKGGTFVGWKLPVTWRIIPLSN